MEKWGWIPPYHGTPPYNSTMNTVDWVNPIPSRATTGYRNPLNPFDDPTYPWFSGPLSQFVNNGWSSPTTGVYNYVAKTVGSNNTPIPVLQQGLTFVYDRQLSCPRNNPFPVSAAPTADPTPLRVDQYNRMLPVTPMLPVSQQTLYFGQPQ